MNETPSSQSKLLRGLLLAGSFFIFVSSVFFGVMGNLLKGAGWLLIGAGVVALVVIAAALAFVSVSCAAVIAAVVWAVWAQARRTLEIARMFLRWAAV